VKGTLPSESLLGSELSVILALSIRLSAGTRFCIGTSIEVFIELLATIPVV